MRYCINRRCEWTDRQTLMITIPHEPKEDRSKNDNAYTLVQAIENNIIQGKHELNKKASERVTYGNMDF